MSGKYYLDCMACRGKGWVRVPNPFSYGDVVSEECHVCEGTGTREVTEEHYEQIANAGAIK